MSEADPGLTVTASKMELFVTIADGWTALNIVIKSSIFDNVAFLVPKTIIPSKQAKNYLKSYLPSNPNFSPISVHAFLFTSFLWYSLLLLSKRTGYSETYAESCSHKSKLFISFSSSIASYKTTEHRYSWTLDAGLWTLGTGPWTLDHKLWAFDPGRWALDAGVRTLDLGRWKLDPRLWTLDAGLWTLEAGPGTLDSGCWILIREHRGQNSGGSRLVSGLESAVAARISPCN